MMNAADSTVPSEMAKYHWNRARAGVAAGATAWRNGSREHVAES